MKWLLVIILLLSLPSVFGFIPEPVENVFEYVVDRLPQDLRNGDVVAIIFFKAMLWIIVFATFYAAIKKVFKDEKRVATSIALVASLGGIILIPNQFILAIYSLYAGFFAIAIVVIPLLLVWYFDREVFGKFLPGWAKGLTYLAFALVILFFAFAFQDVIGVGSIYRDLSRWMEIAAVVLLFWGIIVFFEKV